MSELRHVFIYVWTMERLMDASLHKQYCVAKYCISNLDALDWNFKCECLERRKVAEDSSSHNVGLRMDMEGFQIVPRSKVMKARN